MEARALLSAYHADAAFYLAGYSIECALKACVCRTLDQDDFYKPDRSNKSVRYVQERVLREFKTHNYNDLLVLTGLSAKFELACQTDLALDIAWEIVRNLQWTEQARYQYNSKSIEDCYVFVESVETILIWISKYW
jgi:HEPN domain-containing protein